MLFTPDKFKVTLLQASTKNIDFKESTNQKNVKDILQDILCQQLRYIFDGVHFIQ